MKNHEVNQGIDLLLARGTAPSGMHSNTQKRCGDAKCKKTPMTTGN